MPEGNTIQPDYKQDAIGMITNKMTLGCNSREMSMVKFDSPTLLESIRLSHYGYNESFFGRLLQQFQTKNSRAGVHDVCSL